MLEVLQKSDFRQINKATEHIHVAAQFLAMAGKHLLPKKNDDSHTNLGWLSYKEEFITHPLGKKDKIFLMLKPSKMEIGFLDSKNKLLESLALKSLFQIEVVEWIIGSFRKFGLDYDKFKMDIHYQLPAYADFENKRFKKSPIKAFKAFSSLRNWADTFIHRYSMAFPLAQVPRTWPHHFDHAAYIPVQKNKKGDVLSSMNLGLAIHDEMIPEPYFYCSPWKKGEKVDLKDLETLSYGSWINSDFKGSVLPLSEILEFSDLNNQQQVVDQFFNDSIKNLKQILNFK